MVDRIGLDMVGMECERHWIWSFKKTKIEATTLHCSSITTISGH
jgi:hypothetical protein